ncbi:3-oxoacyl-[acyl-carrier-protein] synthase III C-terminal domain-containing protein [Kitasatospora sp. NPDC006697]|uniref:3-oxoacyl-[acyl-carrier-protein] synthase III C-terminal domain-containing protein n=1 Tax=Kitasatospora sp. NPDC006697 TaxID=3364020 RepID=UPI0036871A7E
MTALEAVAVHLPPRIESVEDVGARIGLTKRELRLFRRFHGLDQVRLDPDGTLLDLLDAAVRALPELRGNEHRIRYLLHARSTPVAVPYPINPLHQLRERFGLIHADAFTVTQQACAASLLAVDLAGRLLADDGDPSALALVLAGEKTFTRDAQLLPETSLFAEASTACLVSPGGDRNRVLSYAVRQRPEFYGRPAEDPELMARYQREFQPTLVETVQAALDQAGLELSDIALLLPHNVNQASWRTTCRHLDYPFEQVVLGNVPSVGHSFAADAFINLRTAIDDGALRPGDHYLIAAAGMGATFAAMVLRH